MIIYLITKNKHKVDEISSVMKEYNVKIKQIEDDKYEPKEMNLEQIARYNAKIFYKKFNKPVVIDDTGIFFHGYPDFPGNHPKLMFELLGYKGLLKLLDNKDRRAEFRTVVGYCDEKGVKTFVGSMLCSLDTKVNDPDKDVLIYERILLYKGKPLSEFSRNEKNKFSHRSIAFRKLGEWLNKRSNNPVQQAE